MNVVGKVLKINRELGYGFIAVSKANNIFFSTETKFENVTFDSLKVDDQVRLSVTETARGLFAEELSIAQTPQRKRSPEVTA